MGGRGASISIDLSNVNKNPRKGLTAESFKRLSENNNLTRIDYNGFITFVDKSGVQESSWVNKKTLEWATSQEYEKNNLEKKEDEVYKKMSTKNNSKKTLEERIKEAEKEMSENDKRTIAHLNNRTYKGR